MENQVLLKAQQLESALYKKADELIDLKEQSKEQPRSKKKKDALKECLHQIAERVSETVL